MDTLFPMNLLAARPRLSTPMLHAGVHWLYSRCSWPSLAQEFRALTLLGAELEQVSRWALCREDEASVQASFWAAGQRASLNDRLGRFADLVARAPLPELTAFAADLQMVVGTRFKRSGVASFSRETERTLTLMWMLSTCELAARRYELSCYEARKMAAQAAPAI